MAEPAPRIRWQDNRTGSGMTGRVGTVEPWLFQIWKTKAGAGPWALMSELPGQLGWRLDGDDAEQLQQAAEGWLREFTGRLGASFPAATPESTEGATA